MADTASNGRPAALFIAPIMPSDRGNGLAMRTGFILDTYAKRFAVDLAVVPVAGGTRTAHALCPDARPARHRFAGRRARYAFRADQRASADPKARLAAFRQYGRPSIMPQG